jgi:transcriptional regulator GlxA family with amidase domain
VFRSVAALVHEGSGGFGIGVAAEIFGYDRTARGMPPFDFAICAERPGPLCTDTGLSMYAEHGLDRLRSADLVQILSWPGIEPRPSEALLDAVRGAYERGAIVMSHCTGAFVLAAAGLLDGRRAATHWRYAEDLARHYPRVQVDPRVLYVDEGRVLTGAGTAAGIDLSLYLLRREYGAHVANAIARDMVVPPHRDGGQAQYVDTPLPDVDDDHRLADVVGWMRANLHEPLTVPQLAARAVMSPRSFARHFRQMTGTTPRAWLLAQRLHRAEELLESGDLGVEEVARRVGFGTAAALREQFVRRRGIPPRDYRRAFRLRAAG